MSEASGIRRGDEPAPHTNAEESGHQGGHEKTPEVGEGELETAAENAKDSWPIARGTIVPVKV